LLIVNSLERGWLKTLIKDKTYKIIKKKEAANLQIFFYFTKPKIGNPLGGI